MKRTIDDRRNLNLDWTPGEAVGPARFGAYLASVSGDLGLEPVPEEYDEAVGWDVYRPGGRDDVRVFVEAGVVATVSCYAECVFNGHNVIGLSLPDFVSLLGAHPEGPPGTYEIDGCDQQVYEFPEIGAQVWVLTGAIVTVFCGPVDSGE